MNKRGDVVIGVLVGLAVGAILLYVETGRVAQERADKTGLSTSQAEVIGDEPGKSALTILGPAVAGAGVGWVLDNMNGDSNKDSRDNVIEVNGYEPITIEISGDSTVTTTDNSERYQ